MTSGTAGGRYSWSKQPNGKYTIHGVPIMGEMKKGQKRTPFDVGKDWLEKAVTKIRSTKDSNKYLPPLHIRHKDDPKGTEPAGQWDPMGVSEIQYEGRPMSVIVSDLVNVPENVFRRVANGDIPYRSVEIASWEDAHINSLALLEDDAPFFKFEMLTTAPSGGAVTTFSAESFSGSDLPAVACLRDGDRTHVLFKFDDKPEKPVDQKMMGGVGPKGEEKPGQEGQEQNPNEKQNPQKASGACCPHCSMVEAIHTQMQGALMTMPENNKPVEQPKQETEKKGTDEARLAALEGTIAALMERERKRESMEKVETIYLSAMEDLKTISLHEDSKKALRIAAEKGEDAVKAFVAAFKANVPADPPKSLTELEGKVSQKDPDVVLKYADSPEKMKRARELVKLWEDAKAIRMTDLPVDRFVQIQMERGN